MSTLIDPLTDAPATPERLGKRKAVAQTESNPQVTPTPTPLKSAIELAVENALEFNVERPPLNPLKSEVDQIASYHGGDRATAVRILREQAEGKLSFIRSVLPDTANEIETARAEAESAWTKATLAIAHNYAGLKSIESLLHERANLLAEIQTDQHRLDHASALSSDAAVINMAAGDQLALSNLVKHLPGVIAEKRTRAEELAGEIQDQAKPLKLSVPSLVEHMHAATKSAGGWVLDTATRSLIERGLMRE